MSELTEALRTHGQRHLGTDLGGLLQWAALRKIPLRFTAFPCFVFAHSRHCSRLQARHRLCK